MKLKTEVLIVGAGPVGLVLALELAYRKIPFRIIDKAQGPGETSRAMLVTPRVLESYQKYGLDKTLIEDGIIPQNAVYHVNADFKGKIRLGKFGAGISAYSFMLSYPQDEHEKVLIEKLKEYDVKVEWETELSEILEENDEIEVKLIKEGRTVKENYSYVVGCDGASSLVRKQTGIAFHGETYKQVFYVLDAKVTGAMIYHDSLSFSFSGDHFTLFIPIRNKETTRIIGMFPLDLTEKEDFSYESLKSSLEEVHDIQLNKMNWFSDYKIHRRIASNFRKGRIFLAGDAAHIHSPVGGQGMNAGINDAVNLGWKLASVIHGEVSEWVLGTYEAERKEFAEWLVKTTDPAFKQIATEIKWKQIIRDKGVSIFARFINQSELVRKRAYLTLSQLYVSYNDSEASEGRMGKIKAGDRLPYVEADSEFTREQNWQLHIFRELDEKTIQLMDQKKMAIIKRRWTDKAKKNKFEEKGLYLVRPDGHIAFAGSIEEPEKLKHYLNKL